MPEITVNLTDEEVRRLEEVGRREGLSLAQLIHVGVSDLLSLPSEAFHQAAQRVLDKNAELYRRLA